MATECTTAPGHGPLLDRVTQIAGIAALAATKVADVATTVVLLESPRVVERQAVPVAVMESVGRLPALVLLGALALVGVITAVELGAYHLKKTRSAGAAAFIRAFGYGPLSLLWLKAAVDNAALAPVVLT